MKVVSGCDAESLESISKTYQMIIEAGVHEAATIKEFRVESYSDENQKIQLFDKFVTSLDTTTQKTLDMKSYLKNFNSLDARFHTISVTATNNNIAKKIQPSIISSISRNEYFSLQKKIVSKLGSYIAPVLAVLILKISIEVGSDATTHLWIQKTAMDRRISMKEVANAIISPEAAPDR